MWFGTTPDDVLVDPGFPRRFVPRAFDAILRHGCASLLPSDPKSPVLPSVSPLDVGDDAMSLSPARDKSLVFGPVPSEIGPCQAELLETRAALTEMRRERDQMQAALDAIMGLAKKSVGVKSP